MRFYRRCFNEKQQEEITENEARNRLAPHADDKTWKEVLEKFLYNGGGSRWDGLAIDNEGNWTPFRIGGPKPKDAIIRADKFKLLAFSRKDAKEKVRLLEETYNGALRRS